MSPTPDATVRDILLTRIDELVDKAARDPEEIPGAVEQLHPERARSCRNAITTASVMIDGVDDGLAAVGSPADVVGGPTDGVGVELELRQIAGSGRCATL